MRKIMIVLGIFISSLLIVSLLQDKKKKEETAIAEEIIVKSCISCHSVEGNIDNKVNLMDATLTQRYKTKERLEDFISKEMPADSPGSLSEKEYKLLVEYLWESNLNNMEGKK